MFKGKRERKRVRERKKKRERIGGLTAPVFQTTTKYKEPSKRSQSKIQCDHNLMRGIEL